MTNCRTIATKVSAVLALVFGFGVASPVEGAFALRLSDGSVTVEVYDQVLVPPPGTHADQNPAPNAISFGGSVGAFTVSFGVHGLSSSPPPEAGLLLNSPSIVSSAAGTLTIELTDTDFPPVSDGDLTGQLFSVQLGGGTVSFSAYKNTANTEFDTTGDAAQVQLTGPSDSEVDSHGPLATPYSMTLVVTVVHSAAGSTTLGAAGATNSGTLLAIPEPASLALFGIGLLGAGVTARRRLRSHR